MGEIYNFTGSRNQKSTKSILVFLMFYAAVFSTGFLLSYFIYCENETGYELLELEDDLYASANVIAVSSDGASGNLGTVHVIIRRGSGQVLMSTNPFLEPDTQYSANIAVDVAQSYVMQDLTHSDVIFGFEMNNPVSVVGGPSAGAAMAIAAIAAMQGKNVNESIVITGTITPSGKIGSVGGIIEKARTASESNKSVFLVPPCSCDVVYYERQQIDERISGINVKRTQLVPKSLDLRTYALENWNLEVREVSTIDEALDMMIMQ